MHDIQTIANNLNKDLERISKWPTQWKTNSNPDTNSSCKLKKVHPVTFQ